MSFDTTKGDVLISIKKNKMVVLGSSENILAVLEQALIEDDEFKQSAIVATTIFNTNK